MKQRDNGVMHDVMAKELWQGPCLACEEYIDQGLHFPDKRTSKIWCCEDLKSFEEGGIIELIDSDWVDRTYENDDHNNKDDDDGSNYRCPNCKKAFNENNSTTAVF